MAKTVLSRTVLDCVQKITIACIFDSFTVKDLQEFWWHAGAN